MNTLIFTPGAIDSTVELIVDSAIQCANDCPSDWKWYLDDANTSLRGFLIFLRAADGSGVFHAEEAVRKGLDRLTDHAFNLRVQALQSIPVPQPSYCRAGV